MAAAPDSTAGAAISRVTRADSAEFDALVAIYQASIEHNEQKPADALARAVENPRYRFLIARRRDAVTGFAISYAPAPEDIWLLEYMAVAATQRSSGVGAALLNATMDLYRTAGRSIGVLEVDAICGDDGQRAQKARRLAFYRRNGCRVIDGLDYILPLPGAPPMHLLVHAPAAIGSIAKARLLDWITAIYREVYARPVDDPRPARMIAPLPDPVPLRAIDEKGDQCLKP
jgi:GNAT superfamily N-acetyltransferase